MSSYHRLQIFLVLICYLILLVPALHRNNIINSNKSITDLFIVYPKNHRSSLKDERSLNFNELSNNSAENDDKNNNKDENLFIVYPHQSNNESDSDLLGNNYNLDIDDLIADGSNYFKMFYPEDYDNFGEKSSSSSSITENMKNSKITAIKENTSHDNNTNVYDNNRNSDNYNDDNGDVDNNNDNDDNTKMEETSLSGSSNLDKFHLNRGYKSKLKSKINKITTTLQPFILRNNQTRLLLQNRRLDLLKNTPRNMTNPYLKKLVQNRSNKFDSKSIMNMTEVTITEKQMNETMIPITTTVRSVSVNSRRNGSFSRRSRYY